MESNDDFEFRRAKAGDLTEINSLYRKTIETTRTWGWSDDYPSVQMLEENVQKGEIYCLLSGGQILASCCACGKVQPYGADIWDNPSIKKPCGLSLVCVHPDCRGRGIGKVLIRSVIEEIMKLGYDGVRGLVALENEAALRLYGGFGFKNCGEHRFFDLDWYAYELELPVKE